jgi:hypothetical protein
VSFLSSPINIALPSLPSLATLGMRVELRHVSSTISPSGRVGLGHGRRNFKDTIPLMSSSLVILFGVVKQFCRFPIWSDTECKTPAEYGPQYISTPPPPHSHCLYSIYCTLGRGGGGRGGQREGTVEGQQYTSIVPSSMGGNSSQAGPKIQTMSESIKSVKQNAAKSVNRSTERKADL